MATLKSIKNKYLSNTDGDALGVGDNASNVALLAFKMQAADSIAKFNMVDGFSDAFTDATGVDAAASTNETLTSGYFNGAIADYMGDSSDGSLTTTGNVTHTVQNANGSYDGDMVIKQYSQLTISAGHTMTVNQPCRGLFIYVSGNCTIDGTLSMTKKGGLSNPTTSGGSDSNAVGANGLQIGLMTTGGSQSFTNDGTGFNGCGTAVRTATANTANLSSNGTIFTVSQLGATGGATVTYSDGGYTPYNNGSNGTTGGTTITTGGGGSGQLQKDGSSGGTAGSGGRGGAFSGGAGGGGCYHNGSGTATATGGGDYGGAGGNGATRTSTAAAGGAGNPGGSSSNGTPTLAAETGVGGLIFLLVGGDLSIGASGSIEANGGGGGNHYVDGGGSGGGAIFAFHAGTYTVNNTNSTPLECTGGLNGNDRPGAAVPTYRAGDGGAGGFHVNALAKTTENMTLTSAATTAVAQPDTADIVATYTNGAGTATINTDIKYYVSRDNGTTYTEATMVSQGTTGGHTLLTHRGLDISGQPAGTAMRYKVVTANQSASKETRAQAVSLAWA